MVSNDRKFLATTDAVNLVPSTKLLDCTQDSVTKMLCPRCERIDVWSLLTSREDSVQYADVQPDYFWQKPSGTNGDDVLCYKHSDNIFEVQSWASRCELCQIICDALANLTVPIDTDEVASQAPVILHTGPNARIVIALGSDKGPVALRTLDISQEPESDQLPNLPPDVFDRIHPDSRSTECMRLIADWLRICTRYHNCSTPESTRFSSLIRFLHVGSDQQNPSVVEFSHDNPPHEWVALSYCWGEGEVHAVTLKAEDVETLPKDIPMSTLDNTIRDAVLVTRALNIKYLWVDALCIVQNFTDEDFLVQSSQMREVYQNSTVALVAVDAPSVKQGFLGLRDRKYVPVVWSSNGALHNREESISHKVYLSLSWTEADDKLQGPWTRRGWTLQEGLLPHRLLFYSASQIVWKCCTETWYERGTANNPVEEMMEQHRDGYDCSVWDYELFTKFKLISSRPPDDTIKDDHYRLWYEVVQEYSTRTFKHSTDQLVAISGLAKGFQRFLGTDQYAAGLWREDIIRGLLWYVKDRKIFDERLLRRESSEAYHCPSWSWASIQPGNTIHFNHATCSDSTDLAEVWDIKIECVDSSDAFGNIRRAILSLHGPTLHFTKLYHADWQSSPSLSAFERHLSRVVEEQINTDELVGFAKGGDYAAVLIHRCHSHNARRQDVLVLEAVHALSETALFRRLGVIKLNYSGDQLPPITPGLIKLREDARKNLAHRLCLINVQRRRNLTHCKAVFDELDNKPWPAQTLSVV